MLAVFLVASLTIGSASACQHSNHHKNVHYLAVVVGMTIKNVKVIDLTAKNVRVIEAVPNVIKM